MQNLIINLQIGLRNITQSINITSPTPAATRYVETSLEVVNTVCISRKHMN